MSLVHPVSATHQFSSTNPPFSVELVSATQALGETVKASLSKVKVGLYFRLSSPWKLQMPVDLPQRVIPTLKDSNISSGLTVTGNHFEITVESFENGQEMKIEWPSPVFFQEDGFSFHAYTGNFLIPIYITIKDVQKPLKLSLDLKYTLCASLCIPQHHTLTLTIPAGPSQPSAQAALFEPKSHSSPWTSDSTFWVMLLFAFIGGFVLNFMPCVLPVLSLKLMGLIKKSSHSPSKNFSSTDLLKESLISNSSHRLGFLASFLGIMTSFVILSLLTISLEDLGEKSGWGIHFQKPSFLGFLSVIITLFTCSLWGIFTIELPYFMKISLSRYLSYEHKKHGDLMKEFSTGVVATLLATPCTAPFLGTALGYAFTRSKLEIFLFFMIMGLGFSLPYWVGALVPRTWLKLPRPGPWMRHLSIVLGGILALTTIWLLWILHYSSSLTWTWTLAFGCLFIIILCHQSRSHPFFRWINLGLVICLFLGSFFISSPPSPSPQNVFLASHSRHWQHFAPEAIPSHIQQGKVVIVDITAAWCLTCKLNRVRVFDTSVGQALISATDIVAMQGDWTQQDSVISQYLAANHRAGIPFTIVFGPGARHGIILPEILSAKVLTEAVHQARSS